MMAEHLKHHADVWWWQQLRFKNSIRAAWRQETKIAVSTTQRVFGLKTGRAGPERANTHVVWESRITIRQSPRHSRILHCLHANKRWTHKVQFSARSPVLCSARRKLCVGWLHLTLGEEQTPAISHYSFVFIKFGLTGKSHEEHFKH